MISSISIAGFAIAVATSAQTMTPAPIARPDGVIIQVREGCGPGMVRMNGVCVARSAIRQERRAYYYGNGSTTGYSGNTGATGYSGSSQGHLTYEQAWAACKKFVGQIPAIYDNQRYSRGAACMHNYGYRL